MQAKLKASALAEAAGAAARWSPRKPQQAILAGMRLRASGKTVEVSSTDGNAFYRRLVEAEVLKEGEAVVPAEWFAGLLARAPEGTVGLALGKRFTVGWKGARFDVAPFEGEFPEMPDDTGTEVSASDLLSKAVRAALFCADEREGGIMSGALVEVGSGVRITTLSHRWGVRFGNPGENPVRAVVPADLLGRVTPSDEASLLVSERRVRIESGAETWLLPRMEGEFPSFDRVRNLAFQNGRLGRAAPDREAFLDALDRLLWVRSLNQRETVVVLMAPSDKGLRLVWRGEEGEFREDVPAEVEGTWEVAVSAELLMRQAKACAKPELSVSSPVTPLEVKDLAEPAFQGLIAPVRRASEGEGS